MTSPLLVLLSVVGKPHVFDCTLSVVVVMRILQLLLKEFLCLFVAQRVACYYILWDIVLHTHAHTHLNMYFFVCSQALCE